MSEWPNYAGKVAFEDHLYLASSRVPDHGVTV
jgi:hypothetical protein